MLLHVLIVDEDDTARDALAAMLVHLACHPVAVHDAGDALGALSAIRFDILLLGAAEDTAAQARLITDARALQPALRVIASRMPHPAAPAPGQPDAILNLPATPHGLRLALQDALGVAQARMPRAAY